MVAPMKSIVTQIVAKAVEKILKNFEEGGLADICRNTNTLENISAEMILEVISKVIEYVDNGFCGSTLRKEVQLQVQQRNVERTVLLPIGELKFKRIMYKSKETGEYVYPMDVVIGLNKRDRISNELSARLIQKAASLSYEKSSEEVVDGKVTRQTVKNKVHEVGEVAIESKKEHRKIEQIDIYADEDHVHMQDGSNQQVPLVVISEGKKKESNRNSLINRVAFQGYGMKKDVFWEGISAYMQEEYNLDNCRIVLHSDGAKGIKKASEKLMNVVYVMDEFHIVKHLKTLCSGEIGKKYRLAIQTCIESGNKEGLLDIKARMLKEVKNYEKTESRIAKEQRRIKEEISYFINNWEAIERRELGAETGSCTEAQVSHILSERLSRNPMGWSKCGLAKMGMIRIYVKNGGRVTAADVGKGRNEEFYTDKKGKKRRKVPVLPTDVEIYQKYAKEHIAQIFDGNYDWSIFEKANNQRGKVTGTSILLKAYGQAKAVI